MDLDALIAKADGRPTRRGPSSFGGGESIAKKRAKSHTGERKRTYAATPDQVRKMHAAMRPEQPEPVEKARQDGAIEQVLLLLAKALDRPHPKAPDVHVHLPEQNVTINEAYEDDQ